MAISLTPKASRGWGGYANAVAIGSKSSTVTAPAFVRCCQCARSRASGLSTSPSTGDGLDKAAGRLTRRGMTYLITGEAKPDLSYCFPNQMPQNCYLALSAI
jgi:hypothetical protein